MVTRSSRSRVCRPRHSLSTPCHSVAAVPVQLLERADRRPVISATDDSMSPAILPMSAEAVWIRSVSTVNAMAAP